MTLKPAGPILCRKPTKGWGFDVQNSHHRYLLTLIEKIGSNKTQRTILERIQKLPDEPEKQGKSLVKDLSGLRSVHAAGRYRLVYKIKKKTVIVYVLAAGIRKEGDKKDIYQIAKRLLRAGLLDLDEA